MTRNKRYETVSAPLPVEGWNEEAGFFRFGLPLGWHSLTVSERKGLIGFQECEVVLTGASNLVTEGPYLCMVVFGDTSLVGQQAIQEFENLLRRQDQLLRHKTRYFGGRSLAQPARILLGGNRALVIQYTAWANGFGFGCGSDTINTGRSDVFTLAGGRLLIISYHGMLEQHQQCLPEFFTMLGTWEWRSA